VVRVARMAEAAWVVPEAQAALGAEAAWAAPGAQAALEAEAAWVAPGAQAALEAEAAWVAPGAQAAQLAEAAWVAWEDGHEDSARSSKKPVPRRSGFRAGDRSVDVRRPGHPGLAVRPIDDAGIPGR